MESQMASGRMVSIETTVTMNVTGNFLSDTTEPVGFGRGKFLTLRLIIVYDVVSIRRVKGLYVMAMRSQLPLVRTLSEEKPS